MTTVPTIIVAADTEIIIGYLSIFAPAKKTFFYYYQVLFPYVWATAINMDVNNVNVVYS